MVDLLRFYQFRTSCIIKSPKYKQGRCSITNSEVVNKIFNDFISKEQILFFDFSDLFSAKQTAFFYDQDHLNNAGAKVFSHTLRKKLMNLSLLQ